MAITYNAGSDTITVADGTYDYDDIQAADTAGGWGQMTTQGNQHHIDAKLLVGDGVNTTLLADTDKAIEYTKTSLRIRKYATLQFGTIDGDLNTSGGCFFYCPNFTGTYNFGQLSPGNDDCGNLKAYASNLYCPGFWSFYAGTQIDMIVDMVDCYVKGWGRICGTNSRILRVTNYEGNVSYGGWTIKAPFGSISDYVVCTSDGAALYYYEAYSKDVTIRNGTFRDNAGARYWRMTCSGDAYELTLVDCVSDNWAITWAGSGVMNRGYSVNWLVTDADGNVVNAATVTLEDKDDVQLFSLDTGLDGKLASAQDVLYAIYTSAGGDIPNLRGPFTLTVTKGSDSYEIKMEIDHKIENDVIRLPQSVASYDNIMAALVAIQGTGFVEDTHSLTNIEGYTDILDDVTNGLAAIKAEVEGLGGVAMRGTDSVPTNPLLTNDVRLNNLDAAISSRATPGDVATAHTATDALISALVVDIFAHAVEGILPFEEFQRIMLSALVGLSSGGGTGTLRFRDLADAKDRIVATVDITGNRLVIVLDGT